MKNAVVAINMALQVFTSSLYAGEPPAECKKIAYISEFPFKDIGTPRDPVYRVLRAVREATIRCLIEEVTNNTLMQNPTVNPEPSKVAVGDIAFFIWWRVTGAEFDELFPDYVVNRYRENGIASYFEYIQVPGNRMRLQDRLNQWVAAQDPQQDADGTPWLPVRQ